MTRVIAVKGAKKAKKQENKNKNYQHKSVFQGNNDKFKNLQTNNQQKSFIGSKIRRKPFAYLTLVKNYKMTQCALNRAVVKR